MPYPQEFLFGFKLGTLGRSTFTVSNTLRFQPGLIRPSLLLLCDRVRLSLFKLLALTTLFLLDLMFLSFADKSCF
jgi:hypothetical protein